MSLTSGSAPQRPASGKLHAATQPLDRSLSRPLWLQLLDDLTRRLHSGEFVDAFPGELALGDEYGVSRHTVREALRRLREAGTVSAARGRAPRVLPATEIDQALGLPYSLFASVEQAGLEQLSVVRVLDIRQDEVVADRLGLDNAEPLLYLERLRLADGEPLALDRVWLRASIASPLLQADFTRTAVYDELAHRCGVVLSGGQEKLRAAIPTVTERHTLALDVDTAVFVIDRLGCADGVPIEWRHTLVRADRFSVSTSLSRSDGYRAHVSRHHSTSHRTTSEVQHGK